jgi:hypothetical protein
MRAQITHSGTTQVTTLTTGSAAITAALCAGARRLGLLSATGFLSPAVLGWRSSRLQLTMWRGQGPAVTAALDPVRGK